MAAFSALALALSALLWGAGARMIRFTATKRHTVALGAEAESFARWWAAQPEVNIVKSNPGLLKVQRDDRAGNKYLAELAPLSFPGLRISSTVLFDISRDARDGSISVVCSDGSLKQTYDGNSVFVNLVSKLQPNVQSTNTCGLDLASRSLYNSASLTISFEVAPWFPVNGEMLEKGGSAAIGAGIEKDLDAFVADVLKRFRASDEAKSLSSPTASSDALADSGR